MKRREGRGAKKDEQQLLPVATWHAICNLRRKEDSSARELKGGDGGL
jgi:hypothetical protein